MEALISKTEMLTVAIMQPSINWIADTYGIWIFLVTCFDSLDSLLHPFLLRSQSLHVREKKPRNQTSTPIQLPALYRLGYQSVCRLTLKGEEEGCWFMPCLTYPNPPSTAQEEPHASLTWHRCVN